MLNNDKIGKVYFRTYANEQFMDTANAYVDSAKNVGFDGADVYRRSDLEKTEFYKENSSILDQPRGNGYWLWKPYCIREKLRDLNENDILIYNDAGRGRAVHFFDKMPSFLCRISHELPDGMIAGYATHIWYQARLTKADTFILMDATDPKMYAAPQIAASWSVWRPTPKAFEFLEKWISFGTDPRCINDDPSTLVKYEVIDFQEPRHDQSIFSILVHQMKVPHIDLRQQIMREAMKDEIEKLKNVSQFPKRVFAIENMLRRIACKKGIEVPSQVESLVQALKECLYYTDPNDDVVQIRRPTTKHRPTWVHESREFAQKNPQALGWQHANARFTWPERALWKEKTAGKRTEYIEFLKAQAVIFMIMGAKVNTGRVFLNKFFDEFLDDSKYAGGPEKINRPTGNQLKRELLEEIVKERPNELSWHDIWVAMTAEERSRLKEVLKGKKRHEVEQKREELVENTRQRGDGLFDIEAIKDSDDSST